MKEGRAMLVRIAGVDYGYDLQRWHDHLKGIPRSESLGYTWNRTIALPKVMHDALTSDQWRSAANALIGGNERCTGPAPITVLATQALVGSPGQ